MRSPRRELLHKVVQGTAHTMVCGRPAQDTFENMLRDCNALQVVVCGNHYIRVFHFFKNITRQFN